MGGVVGNMVKTPKSKKDLKPLLTPSQKCSIGPSWVMLSHLIGYMEFLFLKLVVTFLACVNAATLPKETGVSIYSFTFTQSLNVLLHCVLGIYLALQNT
jgi:hypothetical protein